MPVPAAAAPESTLSTGLKSLISAFSGQISYTTVLTFLGLAAGAVVSFVFLWWGIRKLVRIAMSAIRKGRLSI